MDVTQRQVLRGQVAELRQSAERLMELIRSAEYTLGQIRAYAPTAPPAKSLTLTRNCRDVVKRSERVLAEARALADYAEEVAGG